jgi:hypothetical protein
VTFFGITNALDVLQHLLNISIFCEYLDDFMVHYIDDMFIFSKKMEDHEWHVHIVSGRLKEVGLYAKLKKFKFHSTKMEFMGYIIFGDGILMDFYKV